MDTDAGVLFNSYGYGCVVSYFMRSFGVSMQFLIYLERLSSMFCRGWEWRWRVQYGVCSLEGRKMGTTGWDGDWCDWDNHPFILCHHEPLHGFRLSVKIISAHSSFSWIFLICCDLILACIHNIVWVILRSLLCSPWIVCCILCWYKCMWYSLGISLRDMNTESL